MSYLSTRGFSIIHLQFQAAIDQDLHVIHMECHKETQRAWNSAENIYRNGAFSKSVAKIKLDSPLEDEFPVGSVVRGLDTDGFEVSGRLYKVAKAEQRELMVQYDTNEVQTNYVNCQVGANPAPNVAGCKFHASLFSSRYSKILMIYAFHRFQFYWKRNSEWC